MAYKLNGESTTKSSECEEAQKLRTGEVVTSRDNVKLLNLELFKETVKLIQQEQVQNSTVEHFVALAVPRLRPRKFHDPNAKKSKWAACHKARE